MDFQATDNWRVTGRYMKTKEDILQAYGTTWAGNGSDQLPTPTLFVHPGSNYMLSATGVLNNSTSLELSWGRASNSLDYELQLENLFRATTGASGALPYLFPDAVQGDYVPWFQFRGGRTGNAGQYQTDRGLFTNKNITHDVLANLTKVAGPHALKAGFYYQNSFKPQSIFGALNANIIFNDDANNPFDTGYGYANAATGVFRDYSQTNKYAIPEWRYQNVEFYVQDNWKAGSKLTIDYGLRFYWLTPQWDETLQASNFLPDDFDASNAARLYRPVCLGAYPCSGNDRRGMDPRLVSQGVAPTHGEHRRRAVHRPADAGFRPLQRVVPGWPGDRGSAAGRPDFQDLPPRRHGLRPERQRRNDPPRRLGDLLRPAAGQHGVRND